MTACIGQQASTVRLLPAQDAPADPCEVGLIHLGAFTERFAGDIVSLRSLLVAPSFDPGATARAVKVASATVEAFPELQPNLRQCATTAELARRVATVTSTAETVIAPSLATWIYDGERHWVAASGLVDLLPEVLALSLAASVAGAPLDIEVAAATDPAGAHPPSIPPGPFSGPSARYAEFAERIGQRGPEFVALMAVEDGNLRSGPATEVRRAGRRIATFSDTEIGWLKSHPALPCYAAIWKATLGVWTDINAAGNWFVDGSRSSAVSALQRARNHLTTLLDRDYVADADKGCVVAPVVAP